MTLGLESGIVRLVMTNYIDALTAAGYVHRGEQGIPGPGQKCLYRSQRTVCEGCSPALKVASEPISA